MTDKRHESPKDKEQKLSARKRRIRHAKLESLPVFEDLDSFQQRQNQVVQIMAEMVLNARKRGRPKNESGKEE